ncbi:rhodanese-like domain-containing protein [Winogradskyella psychrotolerans]|uniref:rhodanese-like domain-containing protein n=1 Tax=Winogradskyella psychrotolerans TaxID=1344585 RepID=UPI001C06A154|nr:rhodanese-like domain-containing protein [Winogradskyella psychrotolerans]MBU2927722.1 rhodanese-like domain-containing protein [Winogradskyella psychrotolerans]
MHKIFTLSFLLLSFLVNGQESIEKLLKTHNKESIPYISVQELAMPKTDAILLDSRELTEYETSHLKDAIHVGYDKFNIENITTSITDKSTTIVVYCSLGIRSEDIAEQLEKVGYTNVYNLFGGIFEWKNKDFTVYDIENKPTENVHAFSKEWSQWLIKGKKIYD